MTRKEPDMQRKDAQRTRRRGGIVPSRLHANASQGRRATATAVAVVIATAGVLLSAAPALAAFESKGTFGKTAPAGGLLEAPQGIAVEAASGDVFVSSGTYKNAQQTVTLSGATGGTFTLSFEAKTTAAIAYNASALEVQTGLEALTTIGAGNVVVTGAAGGPYTIEFTHHLGARAVATMTCEAAGLSPSGATCTVAATVAGFNHFRVVKYNAEGTSALGELTAATAPKAIFEAPFGSGLAVDNSTAASKGDVYLASGPYLERFKPKGTAGNEPNEYLFECELSNTPCEASAAANAFEALGGATVDSEGHVFYDGGNHVYGSSLLEAHELLGGTAAGLAIAGNELYLTLFRVGRRLEKAELNAKHTEILETTLEEFAINGAHAVAVDPAGDVYLLEEEEANPGHSKVVVYGPNPTPTSTPIAEFGAGEIGEARGIIYSAQGNGRIYVTEPANDQVHVFEKVVKHYALTVTVSPTEGGTVTSTPAGIDCGHGHTECSHEFEEGTHVELAETANAEGHYSFTGWSGACTGTGPCSVTMNAAEAVTATFSSLPVNIAPPTITGTPYSGHTLTTSNGEWTGAETFTYQWQDCNAAGEECTNITGATSSEYTLTGADVGHTVRSAVTAHNTAGTTTAYSAPTAVVTASENDEAHGEVPFEQKLTSNCHVNLGTFAAGLVGKQTHEGECAVTATSTAAESKLTAEDTEPTNHEGHLVHYDSHYEPAREFYLYDPLEVKAVDNETNNVFPGPGVGGPFEALTAPVTLLKWASPVNLDPVTVTFRQYILEHERLNTGVYSKTIRLTLSTTTP
jgi:hypothetical protein